MTFTMTGTTQGREREATWSDGGQLTGDMYLCAIIKAEADAMEGYEVGPPAGPTTLTDHLTSPYSTIELARGLVDKGTFKTSGAVPPMPTIPDGAIR